MPSPALFCPTSHLVGAQADHQVTLRTHSVTWYHGSACRRLEGSPLPSRKRAASAHGDQQADGQRLLSLHGSDQLQGGRDASPSIDGCRCAGQHEHLLRRRKGVSGTAHCSSDRTTQTDSRRCRQPSVVSWRGAWHLFPRLTSPASGQLSSLQWFWLGQADETRLGGAGIDCHGDKQHGAWKPWVASSPFRLWPSR